jgi:HSP20 family protein
MAQKQKHAKKEKEGAKVEFDFGFGGLLGGLFKGIEHLVDLAEKAEKAGGELKKEGGWYRGTKERPARAVYGFTIRTGLGEARSRIQTFGNIKKTKQGPRVVETREPIIDVFDEKDLVRIVVELPGIEEEAIKTEVRGDILKLETTGERKYAKEILVPANVDFFSKEMSFKNGVLEIKFKKKL